MRSKTIFKSYKLQQAYQHSQLPRGHTVFLAVKRTTSADEPTLAQADNPTTWHAATQQVKNFSQDEGAGLYVALDSGENCYFEELRHFKAFSQLLDELASYCDGLLNAIKSSAVSAQDGGASFKTAFGANLEQPTSALKEQLSALKELLP